MIKATTLILGIFLFLTGCTDKNFYVAKLYNDTISIRLPVSWHVIELERYGYSDEIIYKEFIGDSIKREFMEVQVYRKMEFLTRALDDIITTQIEAQKVWNTETKILDHGVEMINGNKVGIIRYTFGMGDNKVYFGEFMLIVKGEELYKIQLFSMGESVEVFQEKCAKIVSSVKIRD